MEKQLAKNDPEKGGKSSLKVSGVLWSPAPKERGLTSDEVHLWCIDLDEAIPRLDQLSKLLSEDEADRASRLRFAPVRERWIAGRAILRMILSSYTAQEPAELVFAYGAWGKPALCNPPIHFNFSHSDQLALCAVSRHEPVGVDVEKVKFMAEAVSIAKRCFSPQEQSEFFDAPIGEKQKTFYTLWTRKEAAAKRSGRGLGQFTEELGQETAARGFLLDMTPAEGYVGCLAMGREPEHVRFWLWGN